MALNLVGPNVEKSESNPEDPMVRCMAYGASLLSLRECLALILRNHENASHAASLASALLNIVAPQMGEKEQTRALFGFLETCISSPTPEMRLLNATDESRILAAFELARRYLYYVEESRCDTLNRIGIDELTQLALEKVGPSWRHYPSEWLGFVPVHKMRPGNLCIVARGVRTHVNVDPAELFSRILVLRPRMIFLFHNHPSGELTPSRCDNELTERVDGLCRQLGIRLHSHWIVSGPRETEVKKAWV